MITGVISSNLVDKPCPNDRVHTRMFVLINSYSLDNVLLGNQSEIPKTKKTPVNAGRATFKAVSPSCDTLTTSCEDLLLRMQENACLYSGNTHILHVTCLVVDWASFRSKNSCNSNGFNSVLPSISRKNLEI